MKKSRLKVLILEDNPADAILVLRELRKTWEEVVFTRVYSAKSMKKELFAEDWDLIISDYSMPQFTGLDGLKILQDSGLDLPFIMVSGTMGEDVAVSVMKAGAGDYILKDKLHRLVPAIERELLDKDIRIQHKRTTKALDESQALSQAVIDGSPLGISVRDAKGTLILYNKAWQKIWGFSEEEINGFQKKRDRLRFDQFDGYLKEHLKELQDVYEKGKELYLRELKISNDQQKTVNWVSQHFYALKNKLGKVQRVVVLTEDITERKNAENRQNLTRKILQILNTNKQWKIAIKEVLTVIKDTLDLECLAIRLAGESDYPYLETIGFSEEFVQSEMYIANRNLSGQSKGAGFTCLCGRVIQSKIDRDKPYSTEGGSFWTNNLKALVNRPEFFDNQLVTRNRCLDEGYKSLALVPLVASSEILGLIQINDHREGKFRLELIKYIEEIGVTIAIAFQRKLSEGKVINSEKQLRSLFDNSIMGIFRISGEGKLTMMNSRLLDLLGFASLAEFEQADTEASEDFRRVTRKLFNTYKLDHNLIQEIETSWKLPNKKNVFVRTSAKVILNDKGDLLYIDGMVEDRTDRMKAARELLESRERYRSLVEKANVGIVTDNLEGKITYFNSKFAKLFGYTSKEMEAFGYGDLFHPDDMDRMVQYHTLRVAGKESPLRYDLRGVKKDGSIIELEIAVDHIVDQDFNIMGTRAFLWDVTERKQSDRIQQALYNISLAISSSRDLEDLYHKIKQYLGTIIDTTNIFVALYNKERDELSLPFEVDEKDHFEVFPAGNSLSSYIIKKGDALMLHEDEINDLARQGQIDLIGTVAKVFLGAPLKIKEETIGVIVVQSYDNPNLYSERDLKVLSIVSTEIANAIDKRRSEDNLRIAHEELKVLHKSLEQKVEKAVKDSRAKDHIIMQQSRQLAIGDMISSIAHHWRQPLNVIGVTFQSVREAFEYNELTPEYMDEKTEIIISILKSLSKTIDDFRFFYKQEERSVDFNIKEAVRKTIFTIKSKFEYSKINLNTILDDSVIIHGSQNEFSQAILNILNNAYDILVERHIAEPKVDIELKVSGDVTRLSIRDNGGGVSEEIRDKIFDLYSSTKKNLNNTGIGLYIARLIIENHMNGHLYLINHPEGAEFVIEI